jgi:hypothetical protein
MQSRLPRFDDVYRPVVCVLAAVQVPVDISTIVEATGLDRRQVGRAISRWREFLHHERGPGHEKLCRVYHLAFREYLEEEVDPGLVTYHRLLAEAGMRQMRELERE